MPIIDAGARSPDRVVVSDLDGTLLDHTSYDWSPAGEALADLRRLAVPLVLASSKTRAEIELWRARLGISDPFVCENGGALYVPIGSISTAIAGAEAAGPYARVAFGVSYGKLRQALCEIAGELGVALEGFGDGSPERISRATGLSGEDLQAALRREFDEPFEPARPLSPDEWRALMWAAGSRGLTITRGGRFAHLTGSNSKGRAIAALLAAYRSRGARAIALALGDGPNDLEMLAAGDRAAIVARPDGTHDPFLTSALPEAQRTRGIGPHGFTEAVRSFLAAA